MSTGSETPSTTTTTLVEDSNGGAPAAAATTSSAATRFVTFAADRPPLQSGFSSVRRGFQGFMSSVDAALKHSTQLAGFQLSSLTSEGN